MDVLLKWAAEIGVSDGLPSTTTTSEPCASSTSCLGHSLIVSHFPDAGGRGLAAVRDLRKGEMVLKVPRSALLTIENAFLRDERLGSSAKRHPYLSPNQMFIVCLLAEVQKARGSWWYPYLTQLPRVYTILAMFMEFETQAFQVDDAIWVSDMAVSKANKEWKQAVRLMQQLEFKPQLLSFKAWLWAYSTVSSRALYIPWDSAGCLCPIGDLFNYAAPDGEPREAGASVLQNTSMLDGNVSTTIENTAASLRLTDGGYEEDLSSYCFYARKGYKRGEQVLLGYGTYTNMELLEHYGFLLDHNPNDKAFLQLDEPIKASDWPKDSLYIEQNGRPSFSLMSALRLWFVPKKLRKVVGHLAYSGHRLSDDNDISVMQFLSRCCHVMLQNLPTSVEDDHALLNAIEKSLDDSSLNYFASTRLCSSEIENFLQANNTCIGGTLISAFPLKVRRSMERWRLAVQWRIIYKVTLSNCISHCNEVIDGLSHNHMGKNGSEKGY